MHNPKLRPGAIMLVILAVAVAIHGQSSPQDTKPQPQPSPTSSLEKKFLANILRDQRAIWTAPFSVRRSDDKWLVPLGVASTILLATDRHTSGELFEGGSHGTRLSISRDFSRLGSAYSSGSVAAAFYFIGRSKHDARARETGLLGAEALVNSAILVTALKAISQRQRPPVDHSSGEFWDGGGSFPSGHATSAWALATVIDHEYGKSRPLVRYGVYGLATAVSLSRYTGTNHFLSDVVVGSALGYGIGRYVYHEHHDRSLDAQTPTTKKRSFPQSRFFPQVAPAYSRRSHTYGAMLTWAL